MITYGSTTLTSYNTITKIEVYYYKSTSATSLSGGSWSTTKPTWENGKYIWQKIRTTYEGKLENGQYYSESNPVNITGQQGQQGEAGTSAYSYKLNASDTIVSVSKNGVYSTNSVTFSATSKQGNGDVNPYEGRFKIETTTDGITWTTQYTSSADESSKIFTIPNDISNIRCSLYQAGGTTVLLDITSVSIVRDGIDGALYPNLSPFFSHDLTDIYNAETNPNGYWMEYSSYGWTKNPKFTFTQLEDGWLHVHIDNSSGTSVIRNDCCSPIYNPSVKKGTMYTFLTEFRNNQSTGAASGSDFYLIQQSGGRSVQFWGINTTTAPSVKLEGIGGLSTRVIDIPSDGSYAIARGTKYSEPDDDSSHWTTEDMMANFTFRANAGAVIDYDIRLSMYEGEYWGNYVPYIISDVTDIRNSAETANNKIDNLEIGSKNLLKGTASPNFVTTSAVYDSNWRGMSGGNGTFSIAEIDDSPVLNVNKSFRIMNNTTGNRDFVQWVKDFNINWGGKWIFSCYARGIGDSARALIRSWNNTDSNAALTYYQIIPEATWTKIIVKIPEDMQWSSSADSTDILDFRFGLTGAGSIEYVAPKLERGNKATDWSPAPEDVEEEISILRTDLQSQIDEKIQTFYQSTNPALSWDTTETRALHDGDLWYYTGTTTSTYIKDNVYRYNASNNSWVTYSASGELFDKVDGKTTVFYGKTTDTHTGVEKGDYLVDDDDGSSYRYDGSKWVKVTDYQSAIDAVEIGGRNFLSKVNVLTQKTQYTEENYVYTGLYGNGAGLKFPASIFEVGINYVLSFKFQKINGTLTAIGGYHTGFSSFGNKFVIDGIKEENRTYSQGHLMSDDTNVHSVEVYLTFNGDTSDNNLYIQPNRGAYTQANDNEFQIWDLQLEKGNQKTDWRPAPEDTTRGTGFYAITTAPTAYTTQVGEFAPSYRIALSTVKSESGLEEVMVGDVIQQGYNTYPVGYVDASYVYLGMANSIRGASGTPGLNNARVILYRRFASAPTGTNIAPTGNVTYTFSTGVAANNLNSWTQAIPSGTDPVYMIAASASSTGTTDTIPKTEWSAPIKILENGTNGNNGTDGYNQATIYLYQRKSGTAPSKPSSAVTYTFSTGALSSVPTGWSRTIPTNNGNPCYVTTATAVAKTTTYSIPASGWSDVVILSQDGEDGIDGIDGTSQNLLLDVYATSLTKVKAPWSRYISDPGNTTITSEFIAEDNLPDPNATHFIRFTDSSATTKGRALCFYSDGTPPFLNGHTYKVGCWVRKHAGQPRINIYLGGGFTWTHTKTITNTEWEWVECVHTFGDTDPSINAQASTYKRLYFYFYNKNVEGSSLDMCGFKAEEIQTNISTARNYLLKTKKLEGWGVTNGTTINDGIATFPEVSANTWREVYSAKNFKYELIRNKNIIFSVKVKADMNKICCCNLCIGVDSTETAYARQKYALNPMYFTGTADWQTICLAVPMSDEYFTSGSGTPDYDDCWVTVRIGAYNNYWNGFQIKEPQLSLGTTATAWSAAPEDIDANIQQVQDNLDNLEIGGRNLILDTAIERISPASSNDSAYVAPVPMMSDYAFGILNNRDDYFTYSFDYEVTGNEASNAYIYVQIKGVSVPTTSDGYYSYVLENPTGKYCCTFKLIKTQATGTYKGCGIRLKNATDGAIVRVWNLKLERGIKATDWTPAPEDMQAEAEKAKKTATNYMSSDNTGIMVADLADGEQLPANATGKNVFITAGYGSGDVAVDAGVHIRDGQTDLAIFGESTRIGKENDSNVSIDNNGIIINKGSKELAKYSSKGIAFDEEIPYKIGNDNSYIAFEDTDNDNRADSLSIVADSIYFRDTANTNIKDTLNGLQSDLAIAQEDIDLKNNYIKINTSEPSIVISASSNTNDTNLKLESSQLSFQIDGQTTATITNDQMNIPTASVTNLFMQSINASTNTVYEKVWVMRTNGHLSLKTITRN